MSLIGNVSLEFYLYGYYANINNYDRNYAEYIVNATSPSQINLNWSNYDGSYRQEESNLFYHMNLIHDFFVDDFNLHEMDFSMDATVQYEYFDGRGNLIKECNAIASGGNELYFLGAGDICEATSLLADVIYHEYTHNVVYAIYDGLDDLPYYNESGAMNEGFADYFSATYTDNSCVGEGFYLEDQNECVRNLDNNNKYPDDYINEVHEDSLIFSGSLWDLRNFLGKETTDKLIIDTMNLKPSNFSEFLEYMLIVDDDNAYLNDGTPRIKNI